jgi:hypothetical protein
MTDVSMSPATRHDVETCAGGGRAASGAAGWLSLAAAPTFAMMALWTGLFSGQPDMLCVPMQGSSPMSGMTLMYLLMSAFNAAPWLRLISRRQSGVHQAPAESTRRVVFEQVVRSDGVIE